MNLPTFRLLRAESLDEACALLASCGEGGKVVAGGTDLFVRMKHRRLTPSCLVDIKKIPKLDYIRYEEGGGLHIGALATIESLKRSTLVQKRFPVLHQAAAYMATVVIRNQATVVGNICNGSPSAEMAPALIVSDATVRIVGPDGKRFVLVEDFFTGPGRTVLRPDEVAAEIWVPEPAVGSGAAYEKFSLRRMDVAVVGAAALVVPNEGACVDLRVVLSAVAPTPMRAEKAERVLRGRIPSRALVEEAARMAAEESRPITDIRGTAELRKNMVAVLTSQVIDRALKAAKLRVE